MDNQMNRDAEFWSKSARKYAQAQISDMPAFDATMDRVVAHLTPDARVLELGCGTGATALRLGPQAGSILATDFASGMIEQAKARPQIDGVQFRCCDVFDPELGAGAFDVVMAFNLLHVVTQRPPMLARVHALLAPGGLFISKTMCLGDPTVGWKFALIRRVIPLMQWAGKAPFVRFDTIADLEGDITAAGFEIIESGDYPKHPPRRFVVARRL